MTGGSNTSRNDIVQCTGWDKFARTLSFWEGSKSGDYVVKLLVWHVGRDAAEAVALYWHEHGRDDIAARVKNAIHEASIP